MFNMNGFVIYKWSTDISDVQCDVIVSLGFDISNKFPGTIEFLTMPSTTSKKTYEKFKKKCILYCESNSRKFFESFKECLTILSQENAGSIAFPLLQNGDRIRYENMIREYAMKVPDKVYIVSPSNRDDDFYTKLACVISIPVYRELITIICLEAKTLPYGEIIDIKNIKHILDPYMSSWKYNKDEFNYDNSDLLQFTKTFLPELQGWEELFYIFINNGYIAKLSYFIKEQYMKKEVYPPLNLIYNSFYHVIPEEIKVLVIGQDPYHRRGQAMGIAFAVPPGIQAPPSLVNIYTEMKSDGIKLSDSPDLFLLVKRKVCFINTSLTVSQGEPGSHSQEWLEYFTPELMKYINNKNPGCVVIMWGAHAQSFSSYFDDKKHRKIESAHPSPLSAHKGFFGSKPFSKANKYLLELKKEPVDWNI